MQYEREKVVAFMRESLAIERMHREPTEEEVNATHRFLYLPELCLGDICRVQAVYAPNAPLRTQLGMDVRVGGRPTPSPGMRIAGGLGNIAFRMSSAADPWEMHAEFEVLHPFMDGNGRTGRTCWAWCMRRTMQDPFELPFLHMWYYQTLDNFASRQGAVLAGD